MDVCLFVVFYYFCSCTIDLPDPKVERAILVPSKSPQGWGVHIEVSHDSDVPRAGDIEFQSIFSIRNNKK